MIEIFTNLKSWRTYNMFYSFKLYLNILVNKKISYDSHIGNALIVNQCHIIPS